jgi:hypothetical protein
MTEPGSQLASWISESAVGGGGAASSQPPPASPDGRRHRSGHAQALAPAAMEAVRRRLEESGLLPARRVPNARSPSPPRHTTDQGVLWEQDTLTQVWSTAVEARAAERAEVAAAAEEKKAKAVKAAKAAAGRRQYLGLGAIRPRPRHRGGGGDGSGSGGGRSPPAPPPPLPRTLFPVSSPKPRHLSPGGASPERPSRQPPVGVDSGGRPAQLRAGAGGRRVARAPEAGGAAHPRPVAAVRAGGGGGLPGRAGFRPQRRAPVREDG